MGMVMECIFAELGLITRGTAQDRVAQTLATVKDRWPSEPHAGFYAHFSNRQYAIVGEVSTVDSAELVMGALFAANYFANATLSATAQLLLTRTNWSYALAGAAEPTIYPVINATSGERSGRILPFNEYFIIAYIAQLAAPSPGSVASQYYATYMQGPPTGLGGHPVHKSYWGYELLTDNDATFMSSFIPLFCYFLTKGYNTNAYYVQLTRDWMAADQLYWSKALTSDAVSWGHQVYGRVWGSGAGPAPSGYNADKLDDDPDLVYSAHIMAGFLAAAGNASSNTRAQINGQLQWMRSQGVCAYEPTLPDGSTPTVLWRCSAKAALSDWRATSVDSVDFSTFILGYATNYLPEGFYQKFAA